VSTETPAATLRVLKRTFDAFEEVAALLASRDIEVLRRTAGRFEGSLLLVQLGSITIGWPVHSAPIIVRSKVERHARLFITRLDAHAGSVFVNGHHLDDGRLVVYPPGATQHTWTMPSSTGVRLLVAIARSDDLDRVSLSLTGDKFLSGPDLCTLIRPAPAAMEAARSLAERERVSLDDTALRDRAEARDASAAEEILAALVTAVISDTSRMQGHEWSGDFAARVVDRAEDFLREHVGERMRLAQLCAAADTTERQLERAFNTVYGVGPNQYIKLHRLHLARRALRNPMPGATTVGDVASRFGFQDFGRFAISYRTLFGEVPSATLARSRRV